MCLRHIISAQVRFPPASPQTDLSASIALTCVLSPPTSLVTLLPSPPLFLDVWKLQDAVRQQDQVRGQESVLGAGRLGASVSTQPGPPDPRPVDPAARESTGNSITSL